MDQLAAMKDRTRSRFWRFLKRALLGLLLLIFAAAIAGFAFQTIAEAIDRRAHPAPGELVDIGGGRLMHIQCAGSGSPVVILEAGLGGFTPDWFWVQSEVAEATRVCAYDRAGFGWSDPGPTPRDANAITADLRALLVAAEIRGPYVLAGHSYGGIFARAYAESFPDDVAGIVLIDSSHPDQWTRLSGGEGQLERVQWIYRAARAAVRLGILRITNFIPADPDLPPQQAQTRKAMSDMVSFVDAAADEFSSSEATLATVRDAGDLGDKPLYVVTAGVQPEEDPANAQEWHTLQDELAELSSNSAHLTVQAATHISLVTRESAAAETAAAILAVVEAARSGGRLPRN